MALNLDWREPSTLAYSCVHSPQDYSCDNAVLFSAEAVRLGLLSRDEFESICSLYESESFSGLLLRYPRVIDAMNWDDHVGAAAVSPLYAQKILFFAESHDWTFLGNNLGRFPLFAPLLRAGAGRHLSLVDQVAAASAYLCNVFEREQEISGKLILWLCQETFRGKGVLLNAAISLWRSAMRKKYANGPRSLFQIYFPDQDGHRHPFVNAAPTSF